MFYRLLILGNLLLGAGIILLPFMPAHMRAAAKPETDVAKQDVLTCPQKVTCIENMSFDWPLRLNAIQHASVKTNGGT